MATRHRSEAVWTAPEAVVKGRARQNRPWVLAALIIALVAVVVLTWSRTMGISDVTYELRTCAEPLDAGSSWAEVQAAGCVPAPTAGTRVTLWAEGDQQDADVVDDTTWTFQDVPVNTAATAIEVDLSDPATSVVLVEPGNEQVRRALTKDAPGLSWTANVGARGPTAYWLLVTPASAGG